MANPKFTTHPASLWTIISRAPAQVTDKGRIFVMAVCAGPADNPHPPVTKRVRLNSLQSGLSTSCGCQRKKT